MKLIWIPITIFLIITSFIYLSPIEPKEEPFVNCYNRSADPIEIESCLIERYGVGFFPNYK